MTYDEDREDKPKEQDFFEKFGCGVQNSSVEIGKTYPVYGAITEIEKVNPGESVVVIINRNIRAILNINEDSKVQLLYSRIFEPGIFATTFNKALVPTDENPIAYEATVHTVVYGKARSYDA